MVNTPALKKHEHLVKVWKIETETFITDEEVTFSKSRRQILNLTIAIGNQSIVSFPVVRYWQNVNIWRGRIKFVNISIGIYAENMEWMN